MKLDIKPINITVAKEGRKAFNDAVVMLPIHHTDFVSQNSDEQNPIRT